MKHCSYQFTNDPKDVKKLLDVKHWVHLEGPDFGLKIKPNVYTSMSLSSYVNAALSYRAGWPWSRLFANLHGMIQFLSEPESYWKQVPTGETFLGSSGFVGGWMQDNIAIFDGSSGFRAECHDKLLDILNTVINRSEETVDAFWKKIIAMDALNKSCMRNTVAQNKQEVTSKYWQWEYLYCVLFKYAGSVLRDDVDGKSVPKEAPTTIQKLFDRVTGFIPVDCEPALLNGSMDDACIYFIYDKTFWQIRVLENRPNINHFWSLYGDFSMGQKFGGNYGEDDSLLIDRLTVIERLGIVNPEKDDAYVICMPDIPKEAKAAMDTTIKRCQEVTISC